MAITDDCGKPRERGWTWTLAAKRVPDVVLTLSPPLRQSLWRSLPQINSLLFLDLARFVACYEFIHARKQVGETRARQTLFHGVLSSHELSIKQSAHVHPHRTARIGVGMETEQAAISQVGRTRL